MRRSSKIAMCTTVLALSAGIGTSTLTASGDERTTTRGAGPDSTPPPVAELVRPVEQPLGRAAEIEGTLDNGESYGHWFTDTADRQRPDYMPVVLKNGQRGYLKVEEAWPTIDPKQFESSEAGREARSAYMETQIKPNGEGETWAPVYDKDGETVIGELLIYRDS